MIVQLFGYFTVTVAPQENFIYFSYYKSFFFIDYVLSVIIDIVTQRGLPHPPSGAP